MTFESISVLLFRPAVLQSLVAIACLACLSLFGVDSSLNQATASTMFVFCSLGDLSTRDSQNEPA